MDTPRDLLDACLDRRLDDAGRDALARAVQEVSGGVDSARLGALLSTLSRPIKARPLEPTAEEVGRAGELVADWTPERWNTLETARVLLLLAHPEPAGDAFTKAVEDAFTYADEGEACALLKALPLLPAPERFVWRVGEGCRSNMLSVFESAACDSPYAAAHLDDTAWKQAVIKSLFVGAPLWRIRGLDRRLSEDLARIALDYVEERRSAGRFVPHELWLCLGPHGGERALAAFESELDGADATRRAAVGLALARSGREARMVQLAEAESDPAVAEVLRGAVDGRLDQTAFGVFDRSEALPALRN